MRQSIVLLLVVVCGTPAMAETPKPPPPAPKAAAEPRDPDQIICRREPVTGSLARTQRICLKRSQWASQASDTRDANERLEANSRVNACGALVPGVC